MDTHASILELKKRAKGDPNKQRRIKNLLAHQEFVEYLDIVRDAKPDLCSLVSASAAAAVVGSFWAGLGALPRRGANVPISAQQGWQQLGGVPANGRWPVQNVTATSGATALA